VACQDWNDAPADPENEMRVFCTEKGKFLQSLPGCIIASGWNCAKPMGAAACPVVALTKHAQDRIGDDDV
jgi:Fe-S-cluster-containing dehydrogenase component